MARIELLGELPPHLFHSYLFLFPLLWFLVSYFWSKRIYNHTGYELGDRHFRVKKGYIRPKTHSIKYDDIAKVEIHSAAFSQSHFITGTFVQIRSILLRILGLYQVGIYSKRSSKDAEKRLGGGYDLEVEGLGKDAVDELKRELIKRSGLDSSEKEAGFETYFRK